MLVKEGIFKYNVEFSYDNGIDQNCLVIECVGGRANEKKAVLFSLKENFQVQT